MNQSFSGASLGSQSVTGVTINDLPNLPGVRRDVAAINPKLYKQFRASQGRDVPEHPAPVEEENSLMSYFENNSKLMEMSKVLSPFPSQGEAYNDLGGRYSLVSQRQDRLSKTRSLPYSSMSSLPKFVNNDGKILSFLAVFNEIVDNKERTRKVEIKFYTEDNTIEILEPKQENSGTWQGKFLKRHQILKPVSRLSAPLNPKDTRAAYGLEDFFCGATLEIYNRLYTVLDCDTQTRNYLQQQGLTFGTNLPVPSTVFDPKSRGGTTARSTKTKARAKLGFFEYDRKVLRFYGIWDCRENLFGDELKVKVHYTLADNTIEIVPIHDRNNGRDRLPKFLKRSAIMKKAVSMTPVTTTSKLGSPFMEMEGGGGSLEGSMADSAVESPPRSPSPPMRANTGLSSLGGGSFNGSVPSTAATTVYQPARPYHWTDLKIGDLIPVAALNVKLTDADEFTREFYKSKDMPLGPAIEAEKPVYPSVQQTIPPYNGFGSQEDSLQTCKASLQSTAPMKDGMKAKLFQGMILRYAARLHNPKEADKTREFILQFHLEDDTIQIREPPIRNSGHKGGIFLQRTLLESHDGSPTLSYTDVYVGATVSVLSHKFDVYDCDQYTFKYMEANSNIWSYSNADLVNRKLKQKKEVLQRVILTYPGLQAKVIDVAELQEILEKSGLVLVKQEVCTLFRLVDPQRTGSVKLTKVLKHTMDL